MIKTGFKAVLIPNLLTNRCRRQKADGQRMESFSGQQWTSKAAFGKSQSLSRFTRKLLTASGATRGSLKSLDAEIVPSGGRKVFKYHLKPVERKILGRIEELPHTRLIPTHVKVEVWRRDKGCCVKCGSKINLHYDHDIPFAKGGSSFTVENVRLLCAKHNLEKSNKIMSVLPWICAGTTTAIRFHRN